MIVILFFFLGLIHGAIIMSYSPIVSPSTAGSSNTSYSFSFQNQDSVTLTSTSSLIIQFTGQFTINSLSNCLLSINGGANTTSCALGGGNQIVFSNIVNAPTIFNIFTLNFYSNGANYVGTMTFPVYFSDNG